MTEEENMWCKQVDYNNSWPTQPIFTTQAVTILSQRLCQQGWQQLLCPVVVDKNAAVDAFMADKQVSKIFSSILDVYDMLPLHPDMAFDAAWRSFEYIVETYASLAWGYKDHAFVDTIKNKLCSEVLIPLSNKDANMNAAIASLFKNLSLSSIQYAVNRIFYYKELSVAPQTKYIYDRAKDILGEFVLEHIRSTYTDAAGRMDAKAIRDISLRFYRLMNQKDADFNGKIVEPLNLNSSLQMLINVILYTSRCERFHGDFYSPFRSTKTKMTTYYNYYYLTVTSYTLFWCVLYKLLNYKEQPLFVMPKSIKDSVIETFGRMNVVLPKM